MKIAIVAEAVEIHSGSRAEVELAKQFAKMGHKVIFYAHFKPSTSQAKQELEGAGVKVTLIKSPEIKFIGRFIGALSLTRALKKDQPQIISAHTTLPFLIASRLSGIKVVSTYYGTQLDVWLDKIFPKSPSFLDKIINLILNLAVKTVAFAQVSLADKIITQTNYCREELKKLYGKTAPVVFWGDAPPHLSKFKKPKTNQPEIRLLSVSRIIPYKGFHILIEIVTQLAERFNNLKLTIIGSHPNKKYLSYLRKIKPKNVDIIVDASDEVLANHYQKCDIYVTCDKFLFFGQPILEAATFQTPAIALNCAAAGEVVINGKTGFVAKNSDEFKKLLVKLINSPQLRIKLGKGAKNFASKHTWERCAKNYLKILSKWASQCQ